MDDSWNPADYNGKGVLIMWVPKVLDKLTFPGNRAAYLVEESVQDTTVEDMRIWTFSIDGCGAVNQALVDTLLAKFGKTVAWSVPLEESIPRLTFVWEEQDLLKWGYAHYQADRRNPDVDHSKVPVGPGFFTRLYYNRSFRWGLVLLLVALLASVFIVQDIQNERAWHYRNRAWGKLEAIGSKVLEKLDNLFGDDGPPPPPPSSFSFSPPPPDSRGPSTYQEEVDVPSEPLADGPPEAPQKCTRAL